MQQLQDLAKQKPKSNTDKPLLSEISRLEGSLGLLRDDLSACKLALSGKRDELKFVVKEGKKLRPGVEKVFSDSHSVQELQFPC